MQSLEIAAGKINSVSEDLEFDYKCEEKLG
jgi:hypothetical protein